MTPAIRSLQKYKDTINFLMNLIYNSFFKWWAGLVTIKLSDMARIVFTY